jgi:hypothetical protein
MGFEVVGGPAAGLDAAALHLVVKWSARLGADAVERHLEVAAAHGAVWWVLTSTDQGHAVSESWISRLSEQLHSGVPTYVFISGPTVLANDAPGCGIRAGRGRGGPDPTD